MLGFVVAVIAAATVFGVVLLWPDSDKIPQDQNPYGAQGVSIIDATVTGIEPFDCDAGSAKLDGLPSTN